MTPPPAGATIPRHLALPLAYAISMGWMGAVLPWFALELQEGGVSGWRFTAALVAMPAGRLLVGPLWGLVTDHLQDAFRVLVTCTVLMLIGTIAVYAITGFAPLPWWTMAWAVPFLVMAREMGVEEG